MGADQAIYLLSDMVWNALYIAAPILLATLLVGLLISIFQVTTQLQEITLSYVPKIMVTALLLIVLGPWMLGRLAGFAKSLYSYIPSMGGI
ncbi:flagellar biosynthesis protein FliQ [Hellea balneolensis]|uniref:flagellar biosynthesis protein FliQ n=1 Tax=Hellea balneolensis TaxID=287478 RepID=UPI000479A633|nr:flagellar biosynthesis protein FliQ [Hellea balneolensis]